VRCSSFLGGSIAVLVLGAAPLHAQSPAVPVALYGDAVRHYAATGDAAAAVAPLKDWTRPQLERAIEAYLVVAQGNVLAPAAVLQLEIALGVVGQAPVVASDCLQLGEKLLQRLNTRPPDTPPGSIDRVKFSANWYAAAASVFLLVNDPDRASPFISRGLGLSPASRELRLLEGLLNEVRALSINAPAPSPGQRGRLGTGRMKLLLGAHATYERLVNEHPSFVRARVRLGRVLWMLDDVKGAELQLVRARADAREPAQQYLSAMFLGAIYEQRRDLVSARVMYEQALAAAPESQSAAVALGFLDVMAGRPDRAQARALDVLSHEPVADEWWAYKSGGVEWDAVYWLRQAARQP